MAALGISSVDTMLADEYFLIALAIAFFLTFTINLFWYSLGVAVLMRIGGWSPRDDVPAEGRVLRRRVVGSAVIVTVVTATLDVMGSGILHARSDGLDEGAVMSLAVTFLAVLVLTWAILRIDFKGSMLLAGGMTLVIAAMSLFLYAAFGGDGGSNPAPLILAFALSCIFLSLLALRQVGRWRPAGAPAPSGHRKTKAG